MLGFQDWLFNLVNWGVWLCFAYLGYWMLCILLASFWRSRRLRREATRWGEVKNVFLSNLDARSCAAKKPTPLSELNRLLEAAWAATQQWGNGELPAVISSMVAFAANGQLDASARILDEHLDEEDRERHQQRRYAAYAQQLGLFGTVMGVAECFAKGEGSTPALSALGFALSTTAVGLVIGTVIEVCLAHVLGPAHSRFAAIAKDFRNELDIRLKPSTGPSARTPNRDRKSSRLRLVQPPRGARAPK